MISVNVAMVVLGVYAVLLAAGGVMGFVKAGSRPSLIAGLVSALAALIALGLVASGVGAGLPLGLVVAVLLALFFGMRYVRKGRKFMPNGMMAAVSLVVTVLLVLAVMPA